MPRRRDGRRAQADAARHQRRVPVERNRVLVDGDRGAPERGLGDLAGQPARHDVDEHEMRVRAAADQPEPGPGQTRGEAGRVPDDLPLVVPEAGRQRLLEADGLGGDDVHERPALHAGKHGAIEVLCERRLAEHHPAARAAQRLVRGRRHEMRVRDRARVQAGRDQAGDVRHVRHHERADLVGDGADARRSRSRADRRSRRRRSSSAGARGRGAPTRRSRCVRRARSRRRPRRRNTCRRSSADARA